MSEIICIVKRQGAKWTVVPEGNRQSNGDTIPKALQRGLVNGQRVRVVRRPNNSIEKILPAPDAAPMPPQVPPSATAAQRGRSVGTRPRARNGYFANPYNFVPFSVAMRELPGLAERPALSQDRAADGCYSAKLVLKLETVTPLLTMEQQGKQSGQPTKYSVRRDPEGRPLVAGASVKGMLRSLYEQVTSSRLGIFSHTSPLSVRAVTGDAAPMSPSKSDGLLMARVTEHNEGTSIALAIQGTIRPSVVTRTAQVNTIVSVDDGTPGFAGIHLGARVHAWLQLIEHDEPAVGQRPRKHYYWWRTLRVSPTTIGAPTAPTTAPGRWNTPVPGQPLIEVEAVAHRTGHTIGNKHAERLFVDRLITAAAASLTNTSLPLTGKGYDQTIAGWREKLESFTGDPRPGVVKADYVLHPELWAPLKVGQTLFLRRHTSGRVEFYPGMITRESFAYSPEDLLRNEGTGTAELLPAGSSTNLTAADRIFGWVPPERSTQPNSGQRGQLRVGGVRCTSDRAVPNLGATWQLATLNSPKPSHARFYTRDSSGDPIHGSAKRDGYEKDDRLAGYKVYPHHERADDYWKMPDAGWPSPASFPKDSAGHFKNYLSAPGAAEAVSVMITDWVSPGTTFEVSLYLTSATRDELAALLWILTLSDDRLVLKMGMGKPLGFGSILVSVEWEQSTIRSTDQLREHFQHLADGPRVGAEDARTWISEFDAAFLHRAPKVYQSIVAAARGTELAAHYPRTAPMTVEAPPQAETYNWFVDNERQPTGRKHALPLMYRPDGPELLPNDPTKPLGH